LRQTPTPNKEKYALQKSLLNRKLKIMDYRRIWAPGATYFFTVNLQQRRNNPLLVTR